MDRRTRRYVPTSEGLEGRQLMATGASALNPFSGSLQNPYSTTPGGTQIDGSAPVADTIEAKLQHIQNYPFFIGELNRDGVVPQPAVANIQADLKSLIGALHPGDTGAVLAFNKDLRNAENTQNILPSQAQTLNQDFASALTAAGASSDVTADLETQMNSLVKQATQQEDPSIVVRNEYATTLELALGTGRPLLAPAKPRLGSASRKGTSSGLDVTNLAQPSLSGTYAAGVNIQIVDANNTVFGTATTGTNGTYTVKFANPLPNGTYTVRVRAQDDGYYSPASKTYTFVVDVKAPKVKLAASTPSGPANAT